MIALIKLNLIQVSGLRVYSSGTIWFWGFYSGSINFESFSDIHTVWIINMNHKNECQKLESKDGLRFEGPSSDASVAWDSFCLFMIYWRYSLNGLILMPLFCKEIKRLQLKVQHVLNCINVQMQQFLLPQTWVQQNLTIFLRQRKNFV